MTIPVEARLAQVRREAELAARSFLADEVLIIAVAGLLEHDSSAQEQQPTENALSEDVARAARTFVETGGLDDIAHPEPYWVVIAQALARQVISGAASGARVASARRRLGEAPSWVYDLWMDACNGQLAAMDTAVRQIWLEELGRMPAIEREGERDNRAVVVLRTSAAWTVVDALQLWTEDPVAFREVGSWTPLNLLHRVDPFLWLQAIDRWSDPRLVHGALFSAGARETEDEFVEFFRIARPCFSDDGVPTGACAAVVLCESAMQCAHRSFDSTESVGKAEALSYLQRIVRALHGRPDGKTLILALAAKIADEVFLTDNTHRVPSPVPALAWEAACASLLASAPTVAEQRIAFEARRGRAPDERGAVRRILPALVVALRTLGNRRSEDVDALLQWLGDALSVASEWTGTATRTYMLDLIADVLSLAAEPIDSCQTIFAAMEPARRRWEFSKTYFEHHGELPSLLVLVALVQLVLRGHSRDPIAQLAFVRDRALRIALTDAGTTEPALRAHEVVAIALTAAAKMFGQADPRTIELMRPIAQDRAAMGHLLHRLARTVGVGDARAWLKELCRTPEDVMAEATMWAEATGHPFDAAIARVTVAALTSGKADS